MGSPSLAQKTVAKLEKVEGGCTIALWVHRVELWGCMYGEKLDLITVHYWKMGQRSRPKAPAAVAADTASVSAATAASTFGLDWAQERDISTGS